MHSVLGLGDMDFVFYCNILWYYYDNDKDYDRLYNFWVINSCLGGTNLVSHTFPFH